MIRATLYLLPAWLSEDTPPEAVVPAPVLARLRSLRAFVAEDAKSARRFLAACAHPGPMRELHIAELNEHTPASAVAGLLAPLREGQDLGLLSEAGLPAVADPGAALVAAAHGEGVRVVPLPGSSSLLLALAASGLEGQRFRFAGYLPAASAERNRAIAELEARSAQARETQVFIETPYRGDALLADLLSACKPATRLCIATDVTGPHESVRTLCVADWRALGHRIGKLPTVFLLLA